MRFSLSSGKNVQVMFDHQYHAVMVAKEPHKTVVKPYKTICTISFWPKGEEYSELNVSSFDGHAVCVKGDNFSKLTGRKISFNKALSGIRLLGYLTKAERKELFQKVFPQYSSNTETKKLMQKVIDCYMNFSKEAEPELTWFQKLKKNLAETILDW